ncbi:MAG: glycosyltransferase [Candidatus Moranbacteria bacterium]|nr:glycosyltransferase [Candidatus Moranbacteria bacterium]
MNILEINKFHYLRRGAERHYLDVIDLLKSEGHEVAVFAMQHPKTIPSKWEKFFVSYVGYNREDSNLWQRILGTGRLLWSFEARKKAKALLREFRPDIVHLHNIYHQLSPSILPALKQTGAKIVMTVHDYNLISPDKDRYYEKVGKQYWKFLFVKKYGFAKRALLIVKMYAEKCFDLYNRTVDVFIAPSRFVKEALVRGGMDEGKIVVIPHFIAREKTDIVAVKDAPYALYFGSLSKEKGIAELIRICETLCVPLVLAGTCENGFAIPESRWVKHVGQQSRERIESLIASSTCVVSGSQLPETFGLIALEAISFGKPFFGLMSGAYAEIIENGKNGALTENFDALKVALEKFFKGELSFDASEIQKNAYATFGADAYYTRFMEVVRR